MMKSILFFLVSALFVDTSMVSATVVSNQNAFLLDSISCTDGKSLHFTEYECFGGVQAGVCELGAYAYVNGTFCGSLPEVSKVEVQNCISGYCECWSGSAPASSTCMCVDSQ